ncbi:MAG: protein kinase [Planctomycetes bacterium]|nr:protein kinase [Planctomycetota bacterium]
MSAHLEAGQRVSEYLLEERVGSGGFGEVWRARHHLWPEQVVAIKLPTEPEFVRQLRREGVIQHKLESPHVVRTRGCDPSHEPPYLVMDYVDGESLRELLRRRGCLPPAEALGVARQVLEGLSVAHAAGVVHRDLKPENVLVGTDGVVRLTDFGLGRVSERAAASIALSGSVASEAGGLTGTLRYLAPEQRDDPDEVDARTDVYAFGLVLFEMLSGELPQGGELPSDLVPGLDTRVDEVFRRCYTRREARYADARAVREALEAGSAPEVVRAAPTAGRKATALVPAGLFLRSVAWFLDLALCELVVTLVWLGVMEANGWWMDDDYFGALNAVLGGPLLVLAVLLGTCMGGTPGKRLLGLRVVRVDGGRVGLGRSVARLLGYCASAAPCCLGFVVIPFHPEKRGFHDLIAGTRVICGGP